MHELRLKEALPRHTEALWKLIKASFTGQPHSPYIATGQEGYQTYLRDRLAQERPDSRLLLVATVKGHIAAFADVTINSDRANFLTRIAVDPEFRGQGIARAMMQRIQKTYQLENRWVLDVLSSNTGARHLYKSLGFKTVATRKWVGRMLTHDHLEPDVYNISRESPDINYKRYGFTSIALQGHTFAVAGSAIRCYESGPFMGTESLSKVHEKFPQTDRAFMILDSADNTVDHLPGTFEIVRSERMAGSF